jgi:cyanophycinase
MDGTDSGTETGAGRGRGSLFVVGGAEDKHRGRLILNRFVETAGGTDARVIVVSTASTEPEQRLAEYEKAFRELGVRDLHLCFQQQRADAQDPELIAVLRRATGVYFTGGDQLRLTTTLGGTAIARTLHEAYRGGLHIGGTSAGASALSTVMIARGRGRSAPRLSSIRLSPGLGILRRVIVDQHFQERDRIGRLMAAVLRNPYMLGFGIDEDTAFIVDADSRVEVIGKGTLTIVDGDELLGSSIADAKEHEPLAFAGMKVHVLGPGWTFDIPTRRVGVPKAMASV